MKKSAFITAFLYAVSVWANPLNFTGYEQSFTVDFSDEKAAESVKITPRGLPEKYTIALSSRWDDTDKRHLNTLAVMKKNGAKGNFYINGDMERDLSMLKDILRDGCLAGVHTVNHYPMKYLTANTHFYEYMANRIAIEVRSQTPVNTQTSPYGNIRGCKADGTVSIGRSLMATGIIGSPDSSTPLHIKELGYPENSCFFMYRINSGDRIPDMKKFETLQKKYLSNPELAKNPAISMSTHSWHTEEGLKILDKMYSILTANKDWWNCNQNEYAAYRYEALNTVVKKQVTGKSVKFTVQRFEPFELGAELPLYFDISGATALKIDGAELADNGKQIKLAHKKGHTLPQQYGYQKLDKVELKLSVSGNDGKVTAEVKNLSKKNLEAVTFTFRAAPMYKKLTARVNEKQIGESVKVTEIFSDIFNDSRHFTEGKPYFAVQMDYLLDGKRFRLYADAYGREKKFEQPTLNSRTVVYKRPKNWNNGEKLSLPSEKIEDHKLEKLNIKKAPVCVPGAIYPGKTPSTGFIGIIEFDSDKESLFATRIQIGKNTSVHFNGEKLKNRSKSQLKIQKGKNRFVITGSQGSCVFFDPGL